MVISILQSVRFFRLFVFVYPEHFNFRLAFVQTPPPLKNERVGSYLTYTQPECLCYKKYVTKYDKYTTMADWKVPAYQLNHCI